MAAVGKSGNFQLLTHSQQKITTTKRDRSALIYQLKSRGHPHDVAMIAV